ncbi:MAG: Flp family type IVb pilin [Bacillota bacterium]|nr:Flp family type IVb pilin [Bacillota bacterium]
MVTLIASYLRHWFRNEDGQTLTEYALILVLIAIVAIVAVTGLGTKIRDIFLNITNSLTS